MREMSHVVYYRYSLISVMFLVWWYFISFTNKNRLSKNGATTAQPPYSIIAHLLRNRKLRQPSHVHRMVRPGA